MDKSSVRICWEGFKNLIMTESENFSWKFPKINCINQKTAIQFFLAPDLSLDGQLVGQLLVVPSRHLQLRRCLLCLRLSSIRL